MPFKRIVLIVLDSLGIGALPDAYLYGDEASDTLGNVARAAGGLSLPNLERLGLGNIKRVTALSPTDGPEGCYGSMAERSPGKDTTTGHWEMAGLILDTPFPTYPGGFGAALMDRFSTLIGRPLLGGFPASGTEIIERLGAEHVRTGAPIVYTSADSVFQIACHEDVVPIEELYEMCQIARAMLRGPDAVGRVIARPFRGKAGAFYRTERRRDFSLPPTGETMLDILSKNGLDVLSVGKIDDIFTGRGITRSLHNAGNAACIDDTLKFLEEDFRGLLFVNLVDFDMKYGHRNDALGYAAALSYFDGRLSEITGRMENSDLLIITGDHGCDPTTDSTDHSREYVPLLTYGPVACRGVDLGERKTFADIAATVCENFGFSNPFDAESFLLDITTDKNDTYNR